ncbi:MAG: DUF4241 domain-containing protein [Corynebacterium sp.]|uniref:DUF4241 domain-containing protein n=1 Tax=Corynebacterium sp. TaxID=1720 RepID=UPI0026DB0AB0|nr:DUF4241 domain-containing protein [Corynebacterium sp.]MDO5098315.1 DUF4241 domain-containing protein [Corynebacterium sp.]
MTERSCFAYAERATDSSDGETYRLTRTPLGKLTITSGSIEACDPFVSLGESLHFPAPNGEFDVFVTIAHITEEENPHLREAYLSVVFSPDPAVRYADAIPTNADPQELDEDDDDHEVVFGVGVDAGTVAFVDSTAAKTVTKHCQENGINFDEDFIDNDTPDCWFALMDSPDHFKAGLANIPLPFVSGNENVVLSHSGWGDGFYPVLAGFSAEGELVSYHIDLEIVDSPAP